MGIEVTLDDTEPLRIPKAPPQPDVIVSTNIEVVLFDEEEIEQDDDDVESWKQDITGDDDDDDDDGATLDSRQEFISPPQQEQQTSEHGGEGTNKDSSEISVEESIPPEQQQQERQKHQACLQESCKRNAEDEGDNQLTVFEESGVRGGGDEETNEDCSTISVEGVILPQQQQQQQEQQQHHQPQQQERQERQEQQQPQQSMSEGRDFEEAREDEEELETTRISNEESESPETESLFFNQTQQLQLQLQLEQELEQQQQQQQQQQSQPLPKQHWDSKIESPPGMEGVLSFLQAIRFSEDHYPDDDEKKECDGERGINETTICVEQQKIQAAEYDPESTVEVTPLNKKQGLKQEQEQEQERTNILRKSSTIAERIKVFGGINTTAKGYDHTLSNSNYAGATARHVTFEEIPPNKDVATCTGKDHQAGAMDGKMDPVPLSEQDLVLAFLAAGTPAERRPSKRKTTKRVTFFGLEPVENTLSTSLGRAIKKLPPMPENREVSISENSTTSIMDHCGILKDLAATNPSSVPNYGDNNNSGRKRETTHQDIDIQRLPALIDDCSTLIQDDDSLADVLDDFVDMPSACTILNSRSG